MSERQNPLVRDASHALAALFGDCRRFGREWERREAGAGAGRREGFAGLWRGRWRSETTGHAGELRCVTTRLGAGLYAAFFRAGYMKFLRACYETRLAGAEDGGVFRFRGAQDLGRLAGGLYEYEGEATAEEFVSSYRSRYDRGEFRMRRCG
jgi:hypothetical protein